ncbi:MAG: hypothetical protein MI974_15010 [Chitinophagales bacterium]|nr:hypothetical protein [Chitinophagales bacterium]
MKELKFSVFDLFSYALPGGIILLPIWVFREDIKSLNDLFGQLSDISLSLGIILIFVAYIIGNVIDNPESWLHAKVGVKIWGKTDPHETKLSNSQKRVLVRELSPQNHFFIQQWKVVKTMSHNLSFSLLILSLTLLIKLLFFGVSNPVYFIILIVISFIFSYIFLKRAHIFDTWYYKDLNAIVETLKLDESVKENRQNREID